jgi:hypothetical protein
MFHVLQQTEHVELADVINHTVRNNRDRIRNVKLVEEYEGCLSRGVVIGSKFEESHRFLPHANLTQDEVRAACTVPLVAEGRP